MCCASLFNAHERNSCLNGKSPANLLVQEFASIMTNQIVIERDYRRGEVLNDADYLRQ